MRERVRERERREERWREREREGGTTCEAQSDTVEAAGNVCLLMLVAGLETRTACGQVRRGVQGLQKRDGILRSRRVTS